MACSPNEVSPGRRRRLLVVAPHFAPTNAPDSHRVRQSVRYFSESGWDAEVLCIDPSDVEAPIDPLLEKTLPGHLPVWREKALPLRWTRRLGMRTLGWRAVHPLLRAGNRLLSARRFDLVFFSTTQWPVLLAGPAWHKRFGVPYVIDLQDPWCTDFYERPGAPKPPGGWKYRVARLLALNLEGRCFKSASAFISVSPDYLRDLGRRYTWFTRRLSATIPFGADEAEFAEAERLAFPRIFEQSANLLRLTYVGAAGPIMRPALEFLFSALAQARRRQPALTDLFRLHFIGTSYAPKGRAEAYVTNVANAFGVADLVLEQTDRVGYFESLKLLSSSDMVMVLGSTDRAYTPSKTANILFSRRPILALTSTHTPAAAVLRDCGTATLFDFENASELHRLSTWLLELRKEPAIASLPPPTLEQMSAHALARRQVDLFERVLENEDRR